MTVRFISNEQETEKEPVPYYYYLYNDNTALPKWLSSGFSLIVNNTFIRETGIAKNFSYKFLLDEGTNLEL